MRIRIALVAAALVAVTGLAGVTPSAEAAAAPKCVGAAAMDAVRPCTNPTLKVTPLPKDVNRVGASFCYPLKTKEIHELCTFGTRSSRAKSQIALLGDSHALHWRAAVEGMAKSMRWHGYSMTAPACFLAETVRKMPIGLKENCTDWFDWAMKWLRRHKEIETIFLSSYATTQLLSAQGEIIRGGTEYSNVRIAGAKRTWRKLPKHIKHVVVIRDTPVTTKATFDCVQKALDTRQNAGQVCAFPRTADVFAPDTAAQAALALKSKRYQVVDLSEYFCTAALCPPVIGGINVYRDPDHMTPAYSRTLAPYLLRKVRALAKSW